MGRTFILALSVCVLLMGPAIARASMTDLYGYWCGTWYVDEKIDSDGNAFEDPPFPSVDFEMSLLPFDPVTNSYGVLSYGGLPAADVVDLALNGTDVSIKINYAPYCGGLFPDDPAYYTVITGSLNAGKITGDYDEATPPATWISWRGPCEIICQEPYVPEPATIGLIALGALGLVRRRRA